MLKRMLALAEARGHPPAAGDLRLLEVRRPGQRPGAVRAGRRHRGLPLHPAAPAEAGWRVHRRLRARHRGRAEARDVIGLQVVTVGQKASDIARDWFEDNRYQDYLYLHGLSVEMAEAMAEYVHKRIRAEWGFAAEDDRDMDKMLQQGYRGGRYSFGYPACPRLEDQAPLLKLLDAERDRRVALRRVAAAPGAVHQRHRAAPPAGEVLLGLTGQVRFRRRRRSAPPAGAVARAGAVGLPAGAFVLSGPAILAVAVGRRWPSRRVGRGGIGGTRGGGALRRGRHRHHLRRQHPLEQRPRRRVRLARNGGRGLARLRRALDRVEPPPHRRRDRGLPGAGRCGWSGAARVTSATPERSGRGLPPPAGPGQETPAAIAAAAPEVSALVPDAVLRRPSLSRAVSTALGSVAVAAAVLVAEAARLGPDGQRGAARRRAGERGERRRRARRPGGRPLRRHAAGRQPPLRPHQGGVFLRRAGRRADRAGRGAHPARGLAGLAGAARAGTAGARPRGLGRGHRRQRRLGGRCCSRRGRELGSPALLADARHLFADVVTSAGVLVGVGAGRRSPGCSGSTRCSRR